MKIYKIIVIFLLLSGCIPIMINENNYRGLPKEAFKYIKSFTPELVNKEVNNTDSLFLYEINTKDIKLVTQKEKFTWIHLWRPFCHAEICQNVDYFGNLAENYHYSGLKLLLISETYDFGDISNVIKNSRYNHPVFVLQDNFYGHKILRNRHRLMEELNPELLGTTKTGYDDYFFKDTILIKAGGEIDKSFLDSLMSIYQK